MGDLSVSCGRSSRNNGRLGALCSAPRSGRARATNGGIAAQTGGQFHDMAFDQICLGGQVLVPPVAVRLEVCALRKDM